MNTTLLRRLCRLPRHRCEGISDIRRSEGRRSSSFVRSADKRSLKRLRVRWILCEMLCCCSPLRECHVCRRGYTRNSVYTSLHNLSYPELPHNSRLQQQMLLLLHLETTSVLLPLSLAPPFIIPLQASCLTTKNTTLILQDSADRGWCSVVKKRELHPAVSLCEHLVG